MPWELEGEHEGDHVGERESWANADPYPPRLPVSATPYPPLWLGQVGWHGDQGEEAIQKQKVRICCHASPKSGANLRCLDS